MRRKQRSSRKSKSAAQGQSTATADNMAYLTSFLNSTSIKVNNDKFESISSDLGTATQDQNMYLEIENFPTVSIFQKKYFISNQKAPSWRTDWQEWNEHTKTAASFEMQNSGEDIVV